MKRVFIALLIAFSANSAGGVEPTRGNVVTGNTRLFSFVATGVLGESNTSRHVHICFPEGSEFDLTKISNEKGFFDFHGCPSGPHVDEAECFRLRHVPSSLQTADAKEPMTLEFAGERLQLFVKDTSSKTVRKWVDEIWSKGDPAVRYALSDALWAAKRVPIGLGEEAEVLLLMLPMAELSSPRPGKMEIQAAGEIRCGK
jgi:hypothetical protein